jgi:TolB-like protein
LTALASVFFVLGCSTFGTKTEEDAGPKKEIQDENRISYKDDSTPRKRLMILPLLDSSEIRGQELRDEAREDFIRELNRTHALIVVDSSELKIDFSKSLKNGEYDLPEIAKQAQQLGVHAVLEGKLLDLNVKRMADPVGVFRQVKSRFEAKVRVRIYTARSAREIFNTVKTVTLEESGMRVAETTSSDRFLTNNPELVRKIVKEAFLDFTPQIIAAMDKMNWEGRVAMINGDRIFLNVGKISGVQIGDILKVSEDGDEVYDPQTGNYIGKTPGRMKGTLEVVSYFGQDGSIAVVHSGSGFKENDRIELY